MPLSKQKIIDLKALCSEKSVFLDPKIIKVMSQDHYWFSPLLKPQLEHKFAELIVQPNSVEELTKLIAYAFKNDIPVTMRGSGTGNYGQGMPMQGGMVVSTHGLKEIISLSKEMATVQAGVKLGRLEREARTIAAELRIYPSTIATATVGGFIAGGAGGVGSVTWGTLWDEGNILAATILTMEASPRLLKISGHDELKAVIHSCGLTCIIVDLTVALAAAEPWQQYTVSFAEFEQALRFGEKLAYNDAFKKRLVSLHEWPIPSFFTKLVNAGFSREGEALALLELTMTADELKDIAEPFGGQITWHADHSEYMSGNHKLSDYSWNHTTLWAMKTDESLTYLQDAFDRDRFNEQFRARRERFAGDLIHHIEFMRFGGPPYPQGMTLVRFKDEARLREIQAYSESLGIAVADAHSHKLDDDIRWNGQPILDAKKNWDPKRLLNPGHLNNES